MYPLDLKPPLHGHSISTESSTFPIQAIKDSMSQERLGMNVGHSGSSLGLEISRRWVELSSYWTMLLRYRNSQCAIVNAKMRVLTDMTSSFVCADEPLVSGVPGPSIKRGLRTPLQAGEVRVFTLLRRSVELGGLPLCATLFLVALFLLTSFLTVPLSGCSFACSSDDALLSGRNIPR